MIQAIGAISRKKNSFEAGREAAEQAVRQLSLPPGVLWAFAAISHDQQKLMEGIAAAAGDVALVSCTTDGEISSAGLSTESVVVLALASDTIEFHTASVLGLSRSSHQAGVEIGRAFAGKGCRYLQLFSDGLTGNAGRIIEGIKSVLGPEILIAGGAAGDSCSG